MVRSSQDHSKVKSAENVENSVFLLHGRVGIIEGMFYMGNSPSLVGGKLWTELTVLKWNMSARRSVYRLYIHKILEAGETSNGNFS